MKSQNVNSSNNSRMDKNARHLGRPNHDTNSKRHSLKHRVQNISDGIKAHRNGGSVGGFEGSGKPVKGSGFIIDFDYPPIPEPTDKGGLPFGDIPPIPEPIDNRGLPFGDIPPIPEPIDGGKHRKPHKHHKPHRPHHKKPHDADKHRHKNISDFQFKHKVKNKPVSSGKIDAPPLCDLPVHNGDQADHLEGIDNGFPRADLRD